MGETQTPLQRERVLSRRSFEQQANKRDDTERDNPIPMT